MKQKNLSEKEIAPPKSRLRENIEALILAILLALFIRAFIVQAFKIPSGSMKHTLQIGDHILVNKFIYGVKLPYFDTTIIPYKKPAIKQSPAPVVSILCSTGVAGRATNLPLFSYAAPCLPNLTTTSFTPRDLRV